jgi:hypothetical protein
MRKLFRKARLGHNHEWKYYPLYPNDNGTYRGLVRCLHCPDWDVY